jgi:hypothetical protein
MSPKKTLPEREYELRLLLATPAGREQLEHLASRYSAASGKLRMAGTCAITYILVHERAGSRSDCLTVIERRMPIHEMAAWT